MTTSPTARAHAHANIALIKYWGKRDPAANLPAVPSLSLTLEGLWTDTQVTFDETLAADCLCFDGVAAPRERGRTSAALDMLREVAGTPGLYARVDTSNNFPTAAGLASSASGFAALTLAAGAALGLALSPADAARLARRASGSAARSIYGGFVALPTGTEGDGADAVAEPVLDAAAWPLEVVIAITATAPKAVGSTDGMAHSAATSPYYRAWLADAPALMARARSAVAARDFDTLAAVSEASCLRMHALAMAADPGLLYWRAPTVAGIECIRQLRSEGVPVFFTVDAGPQIKAITLPGHGARVAAELERIDGVARTIVSGLGPGARVTDVAGRP